MKKIILGCLLAMSATFCAQALTIENKTSKDMKVHTDKLGSFGTIAPEHEITLTRKDFTREIMVNVKNNNNTECYRLKALSDTQYMALFGVHDEDPRIFEFIEDNGKFKLKEKCIPKKTSHSKSREF